MVPEDDNTALNAFLHAVDSEPDHSARLRKKTAASSKSPLHAFVVANWMSVLLLAQALMILILIGLFLVAPSRIVFGLYLLLLLVRWLNYPLVVAALFHDKAKWIAVIAGILYTICSLSGRMWVIAT